MFDQHKAPGQTSATGEESATASPDAESVEAHHTGGKAPAGSAPGATEPADRDVSANHEERSASADEKTTAIRRLARRGGLVAGPASETQTAVNSDGARTPRTCETSAARVGGETEAVGGAETPGDARTGRGIRGRASRLGRDSVATSPAEVNANGVGAMATAAAGAGGDSPSPDGGFPGRPKGGVLAGAAMAGAILIAVPLLVVATGKDDDKSEKAGSSRSADTVLDDDGSKSGAFVAESPTPTKPKADKEPPKQPSSPAAEKAESKPDSHPLELGEGRGEGTLSSQEEHGRRQPPGRHDTCADQEQHQWYLCRHPRLRQRPHPPGGYATAVRTTPSCGTWRRSTTTPDRAGCLSS
ncbi:hypothetical protein ACWC5C_21120 [Streptomyces sp. NPDC001700]